MIDALPTIISVIALPISLIALYFSVRRTNIAEKSLELSAAATKKASELQALISFKNFAEQANYSEGIELIEGLECDDYSVFVQSVNEEHRKKIRKTVEFLNFVANLSYSGHIEKQSVWYVYFYAFRNVNLKLSPWWFKGIQTSNPKLYASAAGMAAEIGKISEAEIVEFDLKQTDFNRDAL
ncbi:MAG: hypothetical protein AAFY41_12355 [Bacteroidota bacterium]